PPESTSDKIRYVNLYPGGRRTQKSRASRAGTRFLALVAVVVGLANGPVHAAPPSVVFILLDTTRADRLSAWGSPNPTSPKLDALAASGGRLAAHFPNAHAPRPSRPKRM